MPAETLALLEHVRQLQTCRQNQWIEHVRVHLPGVLHGHSWGVPAAGCASFWISVQKPLKPIAAEIGAQEALGTANIHREDEPAGR